MATPSSLAQEMTWSSATVSLVEGVNMYGRRSRPVTLARDELTRTLALDSHFQVITREALTTRANNKDPKALATAFKSLVKSEHARGLALKKKVASSVKTGSFAFKGRPESDSDGSAESDSDSDSNMRNSQIELTKSSSGGVALNEDDALALSVLQDARSLGVAPGRFVNQDEIIAAKEAMESQLQVDCIFVLCDYPASEDEMRALVAGSLSEFPLDAVLELVYDEGQSSSGIRDSGNGGCRKEAHADDEPQHPETADTAGSISHSSDHVANINPTSVLADAQHDVEETAGTLHGSKSRNALRNAISLPVLQGQQLNTSDLFGRLRDTVQTLRGSEKRGVLFLQTKIFSDDQKSLTSRCKELCFSLGAERARFEKYVASCVTVTVPKSDSEAETVGYEAMQHFNQLLESMDEELISVGVVVVSMANAVSLAHHEDPFSFGARGPLAAKQEEQAQLWSIGNATTSSSPMAPALAATRAPTNAEFPPSPQHEPALPERVLLVDFADDSMQRWLRVNSRHGGSWAPYAPGNAALLMDRQAHSLVDMPGGRRRSGMPLEPARKPELRGRRQTEFAAFSSLSPADVDWVEQLEHFESMMCQRDPLQSKQWRFKDSRCFVERISPTTMDQLSVRLITSGYTFVHEYHTPSDKLLLAVHQHIPRGRRTQLSHNALQFTDVSPSFADWPLRDLGRRPVFYDVDLNLLRNVGGVTETLFPSDGSEIRVEKFADCSAWVSVLVDGDLFGMQAPAPHVMTGRVPVSSRPSSHSSFRTGSRESGGGGSGTASLGLHAGDDGSSSSDNTNLKVEGGGSRNAGDNDNNNNNNSEGKKPRKKKVDMGKFASKLKLHHHGSRSPSTSTFPATFVAALQDGTRLEVEEGPPCVSKPDGLGFMRLTYSCPKGLVVRNCSDGSVWQSYVTSNLRGVPPVVNEEAWRIVYNLGTVVRQLRDGRTIVMFADGTVAERASPQQEGGVGFPRTPHFIPAPAHRETTAATPAGTAPSSSSSSRSTGIAHIRDLAPQVKLDAMRKKNQERWFVVSFTDSHSCSAALTRSSVSSSSSSAVTAGDDGKGTAEVLKFHADKSLTHSDNRHCVTVDTSRDPETYDTTMVRSDGVVMVQHTSGARTVTHRDGTVIRTIPVHTTSTPTAPAQPAAIKSSCGVSKILIDAPGFAQVEINAATEKTSKKHSEGGRVDVSRGGRKVRSRTLLEYGGTISIEYDTRVTAKVNGFVRLKKPDGTDITVRDDGVVECIPAPPGPKVPLPPEQPGTAGARPGGNNAADATSVPRVRGSYTFDCSTGKLEVVDPEHSIFRVHDAVSPKLQSATLDLSGAVGALSPIVNNPRQPRLFVMNGDGSAMELLQENDVGLFMRHAAVQPGYHQVRCPVYHDVAFKPIPTGTHTTLHRHMFKFSATTSDIPSEDRPATTHNNSSIVAGGGAETPESTETRTVVVRREFAFVRPLDNNALSRLYVAREKFKRYLEAVEQAQNQYDVQDPRATDQLRMETSMRRKINSERRKQRKRLEVQQRKQRAQDKLSHGGKRRGSRSTLGSKSQSSRDIFSATKLVDTHKHDDTAKPMLLGNEGVDELEDEDSSHGDWSGEEGHEDDELLRCATPLAPAEPLHPQSLFDRSAVFD